MKVKQQRAIDASHIAMVDGKFVSLYHHPNGQRMFAADGTMLNDKGNRSIFDDIADDGTEDDEIPTEKGTSHV